MQIRIKIVLWGVVIIVIGLMIHLFKIQVYENEELRKKAALQRLKKSVIHSKRGEIYDRYGKELVVNLLTNSIYADPTEISDKEETADYLANKLSLDREAILKKLNKEKYFVWIKRKVEDKIVEEIKNEKIKGIGFIPEYKRFYPRNTLAAHVLGFVGIDNQPLAGVEISCNNFLKNKEGFIEAERDALGTLIPTGYYKEEKAIDGYNLLLTIDEIIQHIVEVELKKVVEEYGAKSGIIIVNNPVTGEILALACYPTFEPANFSKFNKRIWKNNAISYVFEPGSIFKIISAAAAIEEKTIGLNEKFHCGSSLKVGKYTINCARNIAHGEVDLKKLIQESCNVAAAQLALKLGYNNLIKYIKKFSFCKKTGIELPAEEIGLLPTGDFSNIHLVNLSFGQGIAVTPIQLMAAISAVVNGGVLMKPYIVKEVRNNEGKTIIEFKPQKIKRVLKKETCAILKDMLESTVNEGTATRAAIPGYTVFGKTGTAQKVENGVYTAEVISSFIGFVPKDKPKIGILIIIDEPKKAQYGGVVCAPAFKTIATQILCYLGIPPDKKM